MLLNYYGAHAFFLPGAHSMLKPALDIPPVLPVAAPLTAIHYTYTPCYNTNGRQLLELIVCSDQTQRHLVDVLVQLTELVVGHVNQYQFRGGTQFGRDRFQTVPRRSQF